MKNKIGYISGDFAIILLEDLLSNHTLMTRQNGMYGINTGTKKDKLHEAIKSSCHTWCDVTVVLISRLPELLLNLI